MALRHYLLSLVFLFHFNSCDKSIISPNSIEDLEIQIADTMEEDNIAALSILIFNKDQIKYENYFGRSDINQNKNLNKK